MIYEVGELVQISGAPYGPWGDATVSAASPSGFVSGLLENGQRWMRRADDACIRKHPVREYKPGDRVEVKTYPDAWHLVTVTRVTLGGVIFCSGRNFIDWTVPGYAVGEHIRHTAPVVCSIGSTHHSHVGSGSLRGEDAVPVQPAPTPRYVSPMSRPDGFTATHIDAIKAMLTQRSK